jgi:FAD/FMN-containing dehydrogenase
MHVLWLEVLTAAQGVVRCSPTENADLFNATCGGNGLTGIMLVVAIQMVRIPSSWIKQVGIKTGSLSETLDACEAYASHPYSVAWVDPRARGGAMGRGYLMCGDFAEPQEAADAGRACTPTPSPGSGVSLPVYFPVPLMNFGLLTTAINGVYAFKGRRGPARSLVSTDAFFYPLKTLNLKMFGGGHVTYQFVLPYAASRPGLTQIFKKISESGLGSLISVLKLLGPQRRATGNMSFPIPGFNLGIDFQVSQEMFRLFRELDAMVLDHGGRHYLAKDVCLSPEGLRRGYGSDLDEFLNVKAKWDPQNRFRSLQSIRLGMT